MEAVLAKINDADTNAYIFSQISQMGSFEYWFGIENQQQHSGTSDIWTWTDQSLPLYTNWAQGRIS